MSIPTRQRIIDAAVEEFAAHGLAGARIERIAAGASINKAQLYAHVGNKEALFDAAFAQHVGRFTDAVPFDVEDLPGYATRLYDRYVADPALMRLVAWARLERTPTGDLFTGDEHDDDKLGDIRGAQERGLLDPAYEPADLWAILVAMAATWAQAALLTVAAADDPAAAHRRRQDALARAVEQAFVRRPV